MDNQIIENKPQLTTDNRGKFISTRRGQYSHNVTVQLAKKNNGKVVTVRDIARCQYGRLNDRNERYVRTKISQAARMLLEQGIPAFPVFEPAGKHRVIGIKVVVEYNDDDAALLKDYAEKEHHRGEVSREKYEAIIAVLNGLRGPTD